MGMVDDQQENKHTVKTISDCSDGGETEGLLQGGSKGRFQRRWDLKDNKQPALGRGRVKGSRPREQHAQRPRGRCMRGVLRPSKQARA